MGRRGGSIYVSTNPNANVPIGVAGAGVFIGRPSLQIFETGDPNNQTLTPTPTSGGTVNFVASPNSQAVQYSLLGAATLATLTFTFTNGWIDQQAVYINCTQAITSLTVSGANVATVPALPTSATAGQVFGFVWVASTSKWTRFQ